MKSPFSAPQNNQNFHSKPLTNTALNHPNNTNTTTRTNYSNCNYEPTSVLDLRRSPSPVAGVSDSAPGFTAVSTVSDDSPLHWDDQTLQHHHHQPLSLLQSSEDWDSMIWDLGLKDDSKNLLQFGPLLEPLNPNPPQFPPQSDLFNPSPLHVISDFNSSIQDPDFNSSISLGGGVDLNEFDCSQLDQLIRAAESVELNELQLAQVILARLNQPLQTPIGKPLQRAAFYFKEALQNFLTGSNWANHLSASEIVQKIRAYKIFSEISPIPLFANFTANQALLEASGAMFIHIIDFDIGLGGQWASYMQAIASKAKSREVPPPSLRITAVVPEESSMEASLIKDNLQQFARELGIRFQLDFVLFHSFEVLLFNAIRFINGEMIAVNLSPAIFRLLSASDSIAGFLRFLRRICPQIVVFVDNEGCKDSESFSFRRNFINGLEFYSAMLESLDAANSGDVNLVRRIERFLLRSRIAGTVSAGRNCILPWRELFSGVGLMPVPLSEFTESQADWLVRRTNIRGFHVAKRQGAMMLCWHERELVATSAWMC